jgi:hypothetical protein
MDRPPEVSSNDTSLKLSGRIGRYRWTIRNPEALQVDEKRRYTQQTGEPPVATPVEMGEARETGSASFKPEGLRFLAIQGEELSGHANDNADGFSLRDTLSESIVDLKRGHADKSRSS